MNPVPLHRGKVYAIAELLLGLQRYGLRAIDLGLRVSMQRIKAPVLGLAGVSKQTLLGAIGSIR
jgi:hypothetical protein